MDGYNEDFWKALDELVSNSEIVIDRLTTLFSLFSPLVRFPGHNKSVFAMIAFIRYRKESLICFNDTLQDKFIVEDFFQTSQNLVSPIESRFIINSAEFPGFSHGQP